MAKYTGRFPLGTMAVNLCGVMALGILYGLQKAHGITKADYAVAAGGFVGAFTTLSTLVYESFALLRSPGFRRLAAANYLGSFLLGLPLYFIAESLAKAL